MSGVQWHTWGLGGLLLIPGRYSDVRCMSMCGQEENKTKENKQKQTCLFDVGGQSVSDILTCE
jgi:hypothetical protein